jgi:hypothetical protein
LKKKFHCVAGEHRIESTRDSFLDDVSVYSALQLLSPLTQHAGVPGVGPFAPEYFCY